MNNDELIKSVHAGREVIYNFFYRTYINSPDEKYYTMLSDLMPRLEVINDNEELQKGIEGMKAFLEERASKEGPEKEEYDLDTLRQYTRILCLTDSVPTVESYYTSVEKLAMQEARDEVLKYYSDFAMKKSKEHNEQEDFISVEMHFMSYMANLTVEAIEAGNEERVKELEKAQRNFLVEHPLRWVDQFVARLGKFKESQRIHYPVGLFMLGFIKTDRELLEELLGELESTVE